MFVRVKSTPNSPRKSVQICESRRTGATVKQVTVRYVGIAMDENECESLIRLAESIRAKLLQERSDNLPLFAPEDVTAMAQGRRKPGRKARKTPLPVDDVRLKDLREESRVIEGIQEIFGALFDELGFHKLLPSTKASVLKATVLARLANPSSKHRTAALLEQDFGLSIPLHHIYRMMDALYEKREHIQTLAFGATRSLFNDKVDVVFFDVTTLYFESIEGDGLREFGYSKDQKYHCTQVVLALATTHHGLPIGYKLFSGNTAEVKTLIACLQQWKKTIDIGHVVFVADRAMFCKANIEALEAGGFEYVVAASLRKLSLVIKQQCLDQQGYRLAAVGEDPLWFKTIALEDDNASGATRQHRRLVVSYSSRRARKDRHDRQKIIERLERKLGQAAPVKRLVSNQGYLKFSRQTGAATASIDWDKIEYDAAWDGMHGVITNSPKDPLHILARYRGLWNIEAAFRTNKHDLKMRPIYHYTPERIEAHIAICFLAYTLAQHAQYRITLQQTKMSFEQIRNELLRVQASVLRDTTTGGRYRVPSNMTQAARQIYRAFSIERSLTPTAL